MTQDTSASPILFAMRPDLDECDVLVLQHGGTLDMLVVRQRSVSQHIEPVLETLDDRLGKVVPDPAEPVRETLYSVACIIPM